jgi:aspartyl-tRNA(Asn)/glutamyl-tRNA(Gln) amidotransferase subunit A
MLSAAEIGRAVAARELSAVEVVEAHIAGFAELEPFNALITTCPDKAIERAGTVVDGALAGVPVVVKDLFDTAGIRTTYGSKIYARHVPERTARAVELLEHAGAIVVAKANLHEFAWGTTSQNPHWGFVESPAFRGHVAGGSSGGNAAALALHVGVIGLGTDTAGSLRIPAACCQVVGFKPPHAVVPTTGSMPLAPSFDVAGPMARSVADCALAYAVLTCQPVPRPSLAGLVVGVIEDAPQMSSHDPGRVPVAGVHPDIEADLARLEALGAELVDGRLEPPSVDLLPVLLAEAAEAHRETFPALRGQYGPDTRMKWDGAGKIPAAAVDAARRELPRWRERVSGAQGPDLYVSPTLAGPVPRLDVWEPDVRVAMVGFTRTFSLLGWPAIAIGGLQLAGRDPATVIAAALAWEEAYGPPKALARA